MAEESWATFLLQRKCKLFRAPQKAASLSEVHLPPPEGNMSERRVGSKWASLPQCTAAHSSPQGGRPHSFYSPTTVQPHLISALQARTSAWLDKMGSTYPSESSVLL